MMITLPPLHDALLRAYLAMNYPRREFEIQADKMRALYFVVWPAATPVSEMLKLHFVTVIKPGKCKEEPNKLRMTVEVVTYPFIGFRSVEDPGEPHVTQHENIFFSIEPYSYGEGVPA
jgi:hypothetical protein